MIPSLTTLQMQTHFFGLTGLSIWTLALFFLYVYFQLLLVLLTQGLVNFYIKCCVLPASSVVSLLKSFLLRC